MFRLSPTLSAAVLFLVLLASSEVRAQQQAGARGDSTHVSDWLNALPVSRASLAEYHRRKEAGLLPVAGKSASEIGDTLTFKVWNFRESRNDRVVLDSIDFRLELASDHVLLWVELAELDNGRVSHLTIENLFRALAEGTPPASIDPGRGIMANCEALFGTPPDVNGDGVVDVLVLRIRDDNRVFGINVAGFVWSGDLTEEGNRRDIVYIDSEANHASVAAHEYQHLIHFNYDLSELLFVNEGLSGWSELANGYAPAERANISRARVYMAPLLRFGWQLSQGNWYQNADYLRAGLFTTYMAERIGNEAVGALTRDRSRQGVDSYAAALELHGIALEDFVLDFHVANVLNRVDLHERYGYQTPFYKYLKYPALRDFDARIWEEASPIEVTVQEGAPTYFVWHYAPKLSITVTPEQNPSALRGLALLQQDGRLQIQQLSIGSQANVFEGTYDRVTAVVVHAHPTNTGQGLEKFVLSSSWESSGVAGSFSQDVEALKVLYDSTGGTHWINSDGWSFSTIPTPQELDSWHGVEVESGRVNRLHFFRNGLTGVIPDEIGHMTALRRLLLQDEQLHGIIPATIGKLVQLQVLILSSNDLEEQIPVELADLHEIVAISLDGNRLTGEIPPEFGSLPQLRSLDLSDNMLHGGIPRELGGLTKLSSLILNGNRLAGNIPRELGNAVSLQGLYLENNELVGPIPRELGNLPRLEAILLNGNALTGPIPLELGNLTELGYVRLDSNVLSGEVPPELGNLVQLVHLDLSDNNLTGGVPERLGRLDRLEHLDLSGNALTGPLPESLTKLRNLRNFYYNRQELCAPTNDAFQTWLRSIPNVRGLTCAAVQFAGKIENQAFTVGQAIAELVLPKASGGVATLTYTLEPPLPAGLAFDEAARTVGGTPTALSAAASYTYSATDDAGSSASLTFTIEVVAAVGFQDMIADQYFPRAQPIVPLVFPEAAGGVPPIEYQLTPSLPTGLDFDAAARVLTGTPIEVTSGAQPYTYSATGTNGSSDILQFTLEVYSPVAAEHEALPESFVLQGNYPNPFNPSTRITFDLPASAEMTLLIFDMQGRLTTALPSLPMEAGARKSIEFSGEGLASGTYVYKLTAEMGKQTDAQVGIMTLVR